MDFGFCLSPDNKRRTAVSTGALAAPSLIDESTVSTPGVDTLNTNEQHIHAGSVVNKDAELNTEFSSGLCPARTSRHRFVQDATAASDNNGKGKMNSKCVP
ncbi:unnamed protein product [Phytophthora fragariaefolia]|uniref:Unnamed protein product n=1 Tax=Phytophthora fragariaefolia TaxID=1490495 RepID=A0A9W7CNL6_9STRA|nr:unnamed protein product [Phytophthora fragariaefolia]